MLADSEKAMSTTSLKLPEDLKVKAEHAAESLGMSPHEFMVDAIKQATQLAELRSSFIAEAQSARNHAIQSNQAYAAEDVHEYLRARIAGDTKARLKSTSW